MDGSSPTLLHDPFAFYRHELDRLRNSDRLRRVRPMVGGQGARLVAEDGRSLINFGSNNYLGLAEHPRVAKAARETIERCGVGAGASRLLTGSTALHEELEAALAHLKGTEASLAFSTGYQANIGTLCSLAGRGDLIFADRDCHASLIDGCRLSGARLRVYRRDRVDQLDALLARRTASQAGTNRTLIVTEGVFSMDGDLSPLPELTAMAHRYGALVVVDDAHATGVLGTRGTGSCEHWHIASRSIIQTGTLSKALGVLGGFVAGPRVLIDYIVNRARAFVYTTAPPPALAAAALEAIRVLSDEPFRRVQLWERTRAWRETVNRLGFDTYHSVTPIVPIRVGRDATALALSAALADEGVYAPAIRPPTVPKGSARLRTSVLATHTPNDIAFAGSALERVATRLELP